MKTRRAARGRPRLRRAVATRPERGLAGGAIRAALTLALLACAQPPPTPPGTPLAAVEDGRLAMGTALDLWLVVPPEEAPRARAAIAAAFERVASLEAVASRFVPSSDVSQLALAAGGPPIAIDPRLHAMLALAESGRLATAGAFDVRVGPLVALWTGAAASRRVPDEREIAAARRLVAAPLELLPGSRARLAEPGMSIDLGGIAKGFALDELAADLRAAGFARGLLSFGESSVWALGAPAGSAAWRLVVRDDAGAPLARIDLRERALSISSSLGSAAEIEGTLYGHVVDPRSGRALTTRRQAIVVAPDATGAEIVSKALLILAEPEAREVARRQRAEARVSDERGRSWETPGFRVATGFRELAPAR